MGSAAGTREGDWKCDGCGNRNYAFRSFCNRCKQPRLLVDSKTPADSKWLPRIGDWICAGCSNNNYASREKCNKCGEPKEVAALPAMALPGAAMAAPAFARPMADHIGGLGLGMNTGSTLPLHPPRSMGLDWPFSSSVSGGSLADGGNWRPGDWLCMCGYHNYSSRSMCKQCQAPMPPGMAVSGGPLASLQPQPPIYSGLGVKRLASDDLGGDFVNKRLNFGGDFAPPFQNQTHNYGALPSMGTSLGTHNYGALPGMGTSLGMTGGSSIPPPNWAMQAPTQPSGMTLVPAILGKGAKQWRLGDWMCAGCNNHNFASRATCNRCGGHKETMTQLLPVA